MRTLFPPFAVFVRAMFVSPDEVSAGKACDRFAEDIAKLLLSVLRSFHAEKELIFVTPGAAPIKRRNNEYRYAVIIKLVRSAHTAAAINTIYTYADEFSDDSFRGVEINPVDML